MKLGTARDVLGNRLIKSNMRCIETNALDTAEHVLRPIKSNMRCIETVLRPFYFSSPCKIKSNMRCIETRDRGRLEPTVEG